MTASLAKENIHVIDRNLGQIKDDLWRVEIRFQGMSKKCSLKWSELGFEGYELKALNQSGSSIQGITIFGELDKATKELSKLRREFEHKYIIEVDGTKVITQGNLEAALQAVVEIKDTAEELRAGLKDSLEEARTTLETKIEGILSNPRFELTPEYIKGKIADISQKIPTEDKIENYLKVEVAWYQIKGLLAQLEADKQNTMLQQSLLEATAQRELLSAKEAQITRIRKLRDEVFGKARAICEELVMTQLNRLDDLEVNKPNKRIRNLTNKHLERLQAIIELDFNNSFADVETSLNELIEILGEYETGKTEAAFAQKITEFRAQLNQNLAQIQQGVTDHKQGVREYTTRRIA